MSYSFVQYSAGGVTNQWSVTFPYISRDHVKAYINGVEDTSKTWASGTIIQTSTTPTAGAVVELRRLTPKTAPVVDFSDASTLTASNLDAMGLQFLYLTQEAKDAVDNSIQLVADGTYDAISHRIKNVTNPTAAQDAATKTYVDTADATTLALATTQVSLAAAQVALATTQATNSATSATASATSATASAASATTAAGSVTSAAAQVTLATAQVALATTQAGNSATSATASAASAAAAAVSATIAAAAASGQEDFANQTVSFTATNKGRHGIDLTGASADCDVALPAFTSGGVTWTEGDWFELFDKLGTWAGSAYSVRLVCTATTFDPMDSTLTSFTGLILDKKKLRLKFVFESGKWRLA
ncbi:Bacteriophage T7 tail fibre protein [uncultured Caudovirales phage]|uniref:Bacteriophage T7 tail fibre protein n=1 Tax=uncultured Caudovirales phage TaxID=2100421 RepID=A0A6J5P5Q0_9CAUD|nr:Bacteriophage T7 tail fibre protein [uncultured Caudovirales phage]